MKTIKWNINVDKLKICYLQPQELWQHLEKYNTNDYVYYDCFKLRILNDGRGREENDKPRVKIKASVILDEGIELGTFEFNNSAKYAGKSFFEFSNKALYTVAGQYMEKKFNHLVSLDFVEQQLGIVKNNITCVEVAMDVNFNVIHVIQKMIKDFKNFTLYINGNIISNENRKIQNYGEYFQRTRKKRERYPTIYLTQKKEDSPKLKIYNKTLEIEGSGKYYINEWNKMLPTTYRVEITVKNEDFKKFMELVGQLNDYYTQIESVCLHLSDEEYNYKLWQYITDRMLYFKTKHTNEIITLTDICTKENKPHQASKGYNQHPFETVKK